MKIKNKKLIIFGTGEIGELAYYYFDKDSDYEIVAFTADDEFVKTDSFNNLPLIAFSKIKEKYPPDPYYMHIALSYRKLNKIREEKYKAAKSLGYNLASYVCSKSVYWDDLSIGDNCFILENQTIQPTVKIGNNVMIWSGNHIGHASVIHDHVYISSHVVICGHVEIGERCFLGVNSSVRDFCKVGADTFIGMDASITSNIEEGSVVVGDKTKIFKKDSREADFIRGSFFNI